jgi:hypothetical protein
VAGDSSDARPTSEGGSDIEALYRRFRRELNRRGLSAADAFRHMAVRAIEQTNERPDVAFVECTRAQAGIHAGEIRKRLGVPCRAVTVGELASRTALRGTRHVLTTGFHIAEVRARAPADVEVLNVGLVPSAAFARRLPSRIRRVVVLCVTEAQGRAFARQLRAALQGRRVRISVRRARPATVNNDLEALLGSPRRRVTSIRCVLSLSNWEAARPAWRAGGAVVPFPYRIAREAWPALTRALQS